MKYIGFIAFLIFLPAGLGAQGLEFEDEVYAALPQLAPLEGHKDGELPASIDLSAFCPPVRNQGDVYSCVGWAVGYGALTIKRAIQNQIKDKKTLAEQAYSAMFIYNQIKRESCSQGARISDALKLIRQKGDCLASQFDSDVEDCEKMPDEHLLTQIRQDTIADYLALFDLQAGPEEKIRRTVRALARQEPVIIGMSVRKNFYQLHQANYWWPNIGNLTPAGGHAMVVVGYDLPSASFLLYNSWGTEWGDKGFIRIKFADFGEFCKYAFILKLGEQQPAPAATTAVHPLRTIAGAGALNYLDEADADSEPVFRRTKLTLMDGGEYICTEKNWQVGQLFQLAVWAEQQGLYLYVFSIDPVQTVHIHWPRTAGLNHQFKGLNESALLLDPQAKATIPGPDKALQLGRPGNDVLYLLFSTREIKHLPFIAAKMRHAGERRREHLEAVLGKHLVPLPDIRFTPDQLSFSAETRSEGYIVPMMILMTTGGD